MASTSELDFDPSDIDPDKLDQVLDALRAAAKMKRERKIDFFEPYPKQKEFLKNGATNLERLLMAGNQQGKSEVGAFETACHLTGIYPDWWEGRRFEHAPRAWAVGVSAVAVRDIQQNKLCGAPGVEASFGTGMIPKDLIVDYSLSRGVTDAYDTIQVKHVSGEISTLTFKSYEQGRLKFQGEPVDFIWCDEEPPMEIYSEILARTIATAGMVFVTFTPLLGMSDVVIRFWREGKGKVTKMTIWDADHIQNKQAIIDSFPSHEREARANGEPMLGSGRIFPWGRELIAEPAILTIPPHWFKLWSIDFGLDHPFAAVLNLWDKDNDVIHVHHVIRVSDQLPIMHADPMKRIGINVPVAWPQDGHARREHEGVLKSTAMIYKRHGLKMLPDHAKFEDGGNSTEAGIKEMQERMSTGRYKVASHLEDFFEEYLTYHRKDGKIEKVRDDLMSAARVGVMAKRFARAVALGGTLAKPKNNGFATDVDFDLS